MPVSGRVSCVARIYAEPEVRWCQIGLEDSADTRYSRYARDIKQVDALKPLEVLKPSLFHLSPGYPLKGEKFPWLSHANPSGPTQAGSHPFAFDLASAVRAFPLMTSALMLIRRKHRF